PLIPFVVVSQTTHEIISQEAFFHDLSAKAFWTPRLSGGFNGFAKPRKQTGLLTGLLLSTGIL
ncbi:MAG: hypothetical protein IKE36_10015, partial [Solobacterium sp.]|nr:hypothetical protein [Solobacterium sp.]